MEADTATKGGTGPDEGTEPETEDYLAVEARCMIAVGSDRDTDRNDG